MLYVNYDNDNDVDKNFNSIASHKRKIASHAIIFFSFSSSSLLVISCATLHTKCIQTKNGIISSFRFHCIVTIYFSVILMWMNILLSLYFLRPQTPHFFFLTHIRPNYDLMCSNYTRKTIENDHKMVTKRVRMAFGKMKMKEIKKKDEKKYSLFLSHTQTVKNCCVQSATKGREQRKIYIYSVKKECWWFSALHIKCQFVCSECSPDWIWGSISLNFLRHRR